MSAGREPADDDVPNASLVERRHEMHGLKGGSAAKTPPPTGEAQGGAADLDREAQPLARVKRPVHGDSLVIVPRPP